MAYHMCKMIQLGTRQLTNKTVHWYGLWKKFTNRIEDSSQTLISWLMTTDWQIQPVHMTNYGQFEVIGWEVIVNFSWANNMSCQPQPGSFCCEYYRAFSLTKYLSIDIQFLFHYFGLFLLQITSSVRRNKIDLIQSNYM